METSAQATTNDTNLNNIQAFLSNYAENLEKGTAGDFLGFSEQNYYELEALAHKFYVQQRYDKARIVLEGLVSLSAFRPYPFLLFGEVLMVEQKLDEARTCLEKAHELDKKSVGVKLKLAELYVKLERNDDAAVLLMDILNIEDLQGSDYIKQQRARVIMHALAEAHAKTTQQEEAAQRS